MPTAGKYFDLGSGNGAFTSRLREIYPHTSIQGTDISLTAVNKASDKYENLGIEFSTLDLESDYKKIKREYDLIIMSQLIWYILPNLHEIIHHLMNSALKKGGHLLINQAFYNPEKQQYGKEILSNVDDLLALLSGKIIAQININKRKENDYNSLILIQGDV